MASTVDNGELLALTPDMKVGVKIAANSLDGGLITVNGQHGHAGVIISHVPIGGLVVVNDSHGKIAASLSPIAEE